MAKKKAKKRPTKRNTIIKAANLKAATDPRDFLTDKQRAFVEHYVVHGVGTTAAIQAGYSAKTAAQKAYSLLRHKKVKACLADRANELALSSGPADSTKVRDRLWIEARGMGQDTTSASRVRALELLAKVFGMIVDQSVQKHEVSVGDPVESYTDEELRKLADWDGPPPKIVEPKETEEES